MMCPWPGWPDSSSVDGVAATAATGWLWLAMKDAADGARDPSPQGELARDAGIQASEQDWGTP